MRDANVGTLLIHGNLDNPRSLWVSNAGGTPEKPAFPSVRRGKPGSPENRHNNPRRLLFSPAAFEAAPSPFGKNRNAGQLFQATVKTTASERKRAVAPRPLTRSPQFRKTAGKGLSAPLQAPCLCLFVRLFVKIRRSQQRD